MATSDSNWMTVTFALRASTAVALGCLGGLVFLALLTNLSAELPALTVQSDMPAMDWLGIQGALLAKWLLLGLGLIGFLVPVFVITVVVRMFLHLREEFRWHVSLIGFASCIGMLIALSVIADMHVPNFAGLVAGSGGAIGSVISGTFAPIVTVLGLTWICFALMLVGLRYVLGFGWLSMLETLGLMVFGVFDAIRISGAFVWTRVTKVAQKAVPMDAARSDARISSPDEQVDGKSKRLRRFTPSMPQPVGRPTRRATEQPFVSDKDDLPSVATRTAPQRDSQDTGSLPAIELLDDPTFSLEDKDLKTSALRDLGERLTQNLRDFRVDVEVKSIVPGPVVSRFEIELAPGIKGSKITSLAKDLARALAVPSVRVVEVIPGKTLVGIEVPNEHRAVVQLKEILAAEEFANATSPLLIGLGKNVAGEPVFTDIERMPHLLVAGTTGSGKSVGINTLLLSLLYRTKPDDMRLIMVDPKGVELTLYNGIPHLLAPVVTDMELASKVLTWCVGEMDRRYRLMTQLEVRNLSGYNERISEARLAGEPILDPDWEPDSKEDSNLLGHLPRIVVVVDEFADLMMLTAKKVEQLIARIAQKARAAGIHLVLATQRPSVDVITGLIKSNIPCRISYLVSSQVNSNIILDEGGAEQLLGNGDMLFLAPGRKDLERVHGAFVSDAEVQAVVADWKRRQPAQYVEDMLEEAQSVDAVLGFATQASGERDALYDEAVRFVVESGKASISAVQRRLRVGYNRAARIVEALEADGIVSEPNHTGTREVLQLNP